MKNRIFIKFAMIIVVFIIAAIAVVVIHNQTATSDERFEQFNIKYEKMFEEYIDGTIVKCDKKSISVESDEKVTSYKINKDTKFKLYQKINNVKENEIYYEYTLESSSYHELEKFLNNNGQHVKVRAAKNTAKEIVVAIEIVNME